MTFEKFINKMLVNGWVLDKWGCENKSFFLKKSDDINSYIRVDLEVISKDSFDYLITYGKHNKVFPLVDRRSINDFLEEEDGTITCTKTIRRDFTEDTR